MVSSLTPQQEKYKIEQQQRMKEFVVGNKDSSGDKITNILRKADEYVIYEVETKNLSQTIRIQIDSILEDDNSLTEKFTEISGVYIKLRGLMYKVTDVNTFKYQIAYAVSLAFAGKVEEAKQQMDSLITEINQQYSEQFQHRIRYLVTILSITLLLVAISITVYYYNLIDSDVHFRNFIFIVTGGSIGCCISVSRRLKKTEFEKDVSLWLYILYGFERVCISAFGAIIVYFAIKANLLLGMVNQLTYALHGFILFAIVAGFSETLVPNLLIKLEKEDVKN